MTNKDYCFYRCHMEMASEGEPGLLAATEVVQAVCYAGFQENGFLMKSYPSIPHYYFKYAKTPREGMFKMRAVKKTDMTTLDILIDTRLFPHMIMMEKHQDWIGECDEVSRALEHVINDAAVKQKWRVNLKEHRPTYTQNLPEFLSALEYMKDDEDMIEKHGNHIHIGQLIKVNGNYYCQGETNSTEPTHEEAEPLPTDHEVVEELKPLFYNNEGDTRRFLKEIRGMAPNDVTDLVNQWVKDKRISDYGNSRKGVLWGILSGAGLYGKSRQNWNRRVY